MDTADLCSVLNPMFWEPPQIGWFKLNTDVAVDVQSGKVYYGAIVRNHEGLIILASADFEIYSDEVAIAEAEALPFDIRLVEEISLSPLMVESDSLHVIQLVHGKQNTCIELLWIVSEVQQMMITKHDFRIRHISMSCNQVADALTKFARRKYLSFVLTKAFPQSLDCYLRDFS